MKIFRKIALLALAGLMVAGSLTSCARVFGGKVAESQKRRPAPGEPRREIKVGALIADILLFPLVSLPVDFATGAIYKPKAATTPQPAAGSQSGAVKAKEK